MANDAAIAAAQAVMQAHIAGLNARDEAVIAATLHFPHFRLSGTTLTTWDTPDTYFSDFRTRAGGDWARSEFADIRVLQASAEKVHLDARINRYDHADSLLITFRSLWVITCVDGLWAAKFRSSFAQS